MTIARGALAGLMCCIALSRAQGQVGLGHIFEAPEGTQLKGVTLAADESVFAVLSEGGPDNQGTLVRYMPDGQVFVLHAFGAVEQGLKPNTAPVFGRDGALYGTTSQGGKYGFGTLYRLDDCNELHVLRDFSSDDAGPVVGPLLPAADGGFYAVTYGLYDVNPNREQYGEWAWIMRAPGQIIYISETGDTTRVLWQGLIQPNGGVIAGGDGYLYGTQPRIVAYRGPTLAFGNVYRLLLDGSNFGSIANFQPLDFNPGGQVTMGPDGFLYGVSAGGSAEGPRSFRIAVDFATNLGGSYSEIAWEGSTIAGLAFGDDGNVYGASSAFFRATPLGVVSHIHEIDGTTPPPTAAIKPHPDGGFVVPSGDHLLRLAQAGGIGVLHRFGYQDGAALSSLWQGRDGLVYGTTGSGGENGAGTLFRFDADSTLHTLVSWPGWTESPWTFTQRSELSEAPDGTFYGVSQHGTEYAIFSISSSGVLETLHRFDNNDAPYRFFDVGVELARGIDGALYGTLSSWETGPDGVRVQEYQVFRFELQSQTLSVFARSNAGRFLDLLAARDGALYAFQQPDGVNDHSYKLVRITSDGVLTLHEFRIDGTGHNPASNLVEAADGGIYGYATARSTAAQNVIYRWSDDCGLTIEHSLSASAPSAPKLVLAPNGTLVGTDTTSWTRRGIFIITPAGQIIERSDPGLGTLVTRDSNAHRIEPLTRGAYSGFRLAPIDLPN